MESKAGGEYIRKKSAYCIIQQLMLAASFRSYVKTVVRQATLFKVFVVV